MRKEICSCDRCANHIPLNQEVEMLVYIHPMKSKYRDVSAQHLCPSCYITFKAFMQFPAKEK